MGGCPSRHCRDDWRAWIPRAPARPSYPGEPDGAAAAGKTRWAGYVEPESGVSLPTVAYANELLTSARAMGYGEQDFAALFFVVEALNGGK